MLEPRKLTDSRSENVVLEFLAFGVDLNAIRAMKGLSRAEVPIHRVCLNCRSHARSIKSTQLLRS